MILKIGDTFPFVEYEINLLKILHISYFMAGSAWWHDSACRTSTRCYGFGYQESNWHASRYRSTCHARTCKSCLHNEGCASLASSLSYLKLVSIMYLVSSYILFFSNCWVFRWKDYIVGQMLLKERRLCMIVHCNALRRIWCNVFHGIFFFFWIALLI